MVKIIPQATIDEIHRLYAEGAVPYAIACALGVSPQFVSQTIRKGPYSEAVRKARIARDKALEEARARKARRVRNKRLAEERARGEARRKRIEDALADYRAGEMTQASIARKWNMSAATLSFHIRTKIKGLRGVEPGVDERRECRERRRNGIRSDKQSGLLSQTQIAEKWGVSQSYVSKVK